MNTKIKFNLIVLATTMLLLTVSMLEPELLSTNVFLNHFIDHQLLILLAIIIAVILISAAQVHIEIRRIERRFKEKFLGKTKGELVNTCRVLGWSYTLVITALIFKGTVTNLDLTPISLLNSFCLIVLLIDLLAMIDVIGIIHVALEEEPLEDEANDTRAKRASAAE